METKTQKEYLDYGFGFPVKLKNVPMIKVRGIWTPFVDYQYLAKAVLVSLAYKPSKLTGNEVKFVRTHFQMTLQSFAKRFCVSHVAVLKWEKTKDLATAMNWMTEKDIRLFIQSKLSKKGTEITKLYQTLECEAPSEGSPTSVNVDSKWAA